MIISAIEEQVARLSGKIDGDGLSLIYRLLDLAKSQQELLAKQQAQIDSQRVLIDSQEARIEELARQLSQNSQNSHRPPSSDGYKKPVVVPKSGGKRKKAGGQRGHSGSKLEMSSVVHHRYEHDPEICQGCGHSLEGTEVLAVKKAHVYDIPPMELEVSEHIATTRRCLCCGEFNKGTLPEGIQAGAQYGKGVRSLMTYLHSFQLIPAKRCSELFEDLFGQAISPGTCLNMQADAYERLEPFEEELKQNVLSAACLGADETSERVAGRRQWLHTLSTSAHTLLYVHPNRGRKAIDEFGVLNQYGGIVTHDRYNTYFSLSCTHALCNAHLLRDLEAVIEQTNETWATRLQKLLLQIYQNVKEAKQKGLGQLSDKSLKNFQKRYEKYVDIGLALHTPPEKVPGKMGRPKKGKTRNLLEDLQKHQEAVLRFAFDFRVPFDNNQSERDIRMCKVKLKISGCFRTSKGASIFARIRSFILTAQKQGLRPLMALSDLFGQQNLVKELVVV